MRAAGKRLSADAAQALLAHRWPGNVRELDNVMQKVALVVRGEVVERGDLDLPVDEPTRSNASNAPDADGLDFATAVARFERDLLVRALAATGNNRAAAARRLGMHRQLLYAKLKEHGLA